MQYFRIVRAKKNSCVPERASARLNSDVNAEYMVQNARPRACSLAHQWINAHKIGSNRQLLLCYLCSGLNEQNDKCCCCTLNCTVYTDCTLQLELRQKLKKSLNFVFFIWNRVVFAIFLATVNANATAICTTITLSWNRSFRSCFAVFF